jgi:hypothetical protein
MIEPDEMPMLEIARWFSTASRKAAEDEAARLFADLSQRFDATTAREVFAKVLATSPAKPGKGRKRERHDMDGVWLAWRDTMPGQPLATVAAAIAASRDGKNRSATTIERRLSKLLAERTALRTSPAAGW